MPYPFARRVPQCSAATPVTGTPAAPGRRAPSRCRASFSRPASRQAFSSVNSIRSCCARLPPMRSLSWTSGVSASIARSEIPAFERHEAPRQRRKIGAGRIASLARQLLHLAGAVGEPGIVAHNPLGQDDVHVGEPGAWSRQRAVRIIVMVRQAAASRGWPPSRNARGTPSHPTSAAAARRCAGRASWRRDTGAAPRSQLPACQLAQRQVPAQMAVEESGARIGGKPGATDRHGRYPARRSRSRHARSRARHARCPASPPPSARSSAARRQATHPRTAPWRDVPRNQGSSP